MCQDEIIWPARMSEHHGIQPIEPVSRLPLITCTRRVKTYPVARMPFSLSFEYYWTRGVDVQTLTPVPHLKIPLDRGVLRLAGYQGLCDSDDVCGFAKDEACYGRRNFAWACRAWSFATSA